jgi:hypothetical protein
MEPKTSAAIVRGPGYGNDGGFFWIDANGHVHHVGPWNPEALTPAMREMQAAVLISTVAASLRNGAIRERGVRLAEEIYAHAAKEHIAAAAHP